MPYAEVMSAPLFLVMVMLMESMSVLRDANKDLFYNFPKSTYSRVLCCPVDLLCMCMFVVPIQLPLSVFSGKKGRICILDLKPESLKKVMLAENALALRYYDIKDKHISHLHRFKPFLIG